MGGSDCCRRAVRGVLFGPLQRQEAQPSCWIDVGTARVNMSTIFLHSPLRDFAETQRMTESAYLGRFNRAGELRFFGCGCGLQKLSRIPRDLWMRLFPLLRLYGCRCCGARVLRARMRHRGTAYGPVYLPARSLPVNAARHAQTARRIGHPRKAYG
jgi:hypothetical protein